MTEGPEEDRDSTGRPTGSTNLDLWRLPETGLPETEQQARPRPQHICANVQFGHHVDPPTTGAESVLESDFVYGSSSPNLAALSGYSGRGCA